MGPSRRDDDYDGDIVPYNAQIVKYLGAINPPIEGGFELSVGL